MILLYHGISGVKYGGNQSVEGFDKHIKFLKNNFNVIPYNQYSSDNSNNKNQIVLTFDDGFKNNKTNALPILKKYKIPATFFISTYHSKKDMYLWFAYVSGLKRFFKGDGFSFRNEFYDMSLDKRENTVLNLKNYLLSLKPYPYAMNDAIKTELPNVNNFMTDYEINETIAGLSTSDIKEIGDCDLFDVGIHTIDHPHLTMCDKEEIYKQIVENKKTLESIIQKKIDIIAYPTGDYNLNIIECCKAIGIKYGYAVKPRFSDQKKFEFERIGIYGDSILKLYIKAKYGTLLRKYISIG
jgi:peptidoglycan/xylan/chitin deacetylase (PgdA/CDA1 family)